MKQDKKTLIIILSGLLVFQVFLILLLNVFSKQSIKSREIEKKLLKGLNKDDVVALEISDLKDTFTIEKEEEMWFVKTNGNKMPGNLDKINSYIDDLTKLTTGVISHRGNNPDIDKQYGFDEDSRQKLIIKTKGKKEYTIIIGSTGLQGKTSYIRLNDEKKVREVKSSIASETSNSPIQWVKENIFDNLDKNDIEKCQITSYMDWFKGNYTIKFKASDDAEQKGEFVVDPPLNGKLKDYILENIISSIIKLKTYNYKFDLDITREILKAEIILTLKNDKTFKLNIYEADKNDKGYYLADVDFNNYIYLIDEEDVKRFIKPEKELLNE